MAKKITGILDQAQGSVGDQKRVRGVLYEKSRNGRWGVVFDRFLVAKIKRLLRSGKTQAEVSVIIGITRPKVSIIAKRFGFESFPGKAKVITSNKQILAKNKALIKSMYLGEHLSTREITEVLGFSSYTFLENWIGDQIWKRSLSSIHAHAHSSGRHGGPANQHRNAWRQHLATALGSIDRYNDYVWLVRKMTNCVLIEYGQIVDPDRIRSESYHVDHQFSLFNGYYEFQSRNNKFVKRRNPIPLKIVCHPANLKLLPGKTNAQKLNQNHLGYEQLLRAIKKFESKYGRVFI